MQMSIYLQSICSFIYHIIDESILIIKNQYFISWKILPPSLISPVGMDIFLFILDYPF